MKLLLDTHIAVWSVTGDPKLPRRAAELLANDETAAFVSVASIWEIAIKSALRRGRIDDMPINGHEAANDFAEAGFDILPITSAHAASVGALPHVHGDPFDRLLVATAAVEALTLVTYERKLSAYGDHVLVV